MRNEVPDEVENHWIETIEKSRAQHFNTYIVHAAWKSSLILPQRKCFTRIEPRLLQSSRLSRGILSTRFRQQTCRDSWYYFERQNIEVRRRISATFSLTHKKKTQLNFHSLLLSRHLSIVFVCRISFQPDPFQPKDHKTKESDRKIVLIRARWNLQVEITALSVIPRGWNGSGQELS